MRLARALPAGAAAVVLAAVTAPGAAVAAVAASSAPAPATNPVATITTSCSSGMTVILSNIASDDSATDPVTFSVALPGGAETVTVRADQIKKRLYSVQQVAAGTVSVSAPGMTTRSASYAQACTKVLGEKVTRPATRHTTKTAHRSASATAPATAPATLPFTGGRETPLALLGAALTAAGALVLRLGRRRRLS